MDWSDSEQTMVQADHILVFIMGDTISSVLPLVY